MTNLGYVGWKFLLPDRDEVGPGGIRVTPRGGIAMVEDEACVRQSLLLLLSTSPGERVMRPTYGCDLQQLVFAGNHPTTAGLAMHYVRQAVERWEPRVEILGLDAGPTADSSEEESSLAAAGTLQIVLEYRVRSTGRSGRIVHQLQLAGGA